MFHPANACVKLKSTSLSRGNSCPLPSLCPIPSPSSQKGLVEIGKLNIFLIGLIIVIMFALIAQDEGNTLFSSQSVRLQSVTTPEIAAIETRNSSSTNQAAPPAQTQAEKTERPAESKPLLKKSRKNDRNIVVTENSDINDESVTINPAANAEPVVENQERRETEHATHRDPSRNIIVFNIWSVSELRLRSAFTKLVNDSSAPAAILESRKKDYLSFVNKRTHKCGELNNKFASNINTVEKLTFKEKDLDVLECHTSENITEINRLNEMGISS
jgi:hypothetical protein